MIVSVEFFFKQFILFEAWCVTSSNHSVLYCYWQVVIMFMLLTIECVDPSPLVVFKASESLNPFHLPGQ